MKTKHWSELKNTLEQKYAEVKVSTEGLMLGMYITSTGLSKTKLPIELHNFLIKEQQEIEIIRSQCEYVYIDINKGRSPSPEYWLHDVTDGTLLIEAIKENSQLVDLCNQAYKVITPLKEEIEIAKNVYVDLKKNISKLFDTLRIKNKLDMELIHDSVLSTIESILRNPDSFNLIREFKKSDQYSYSHALETSLWCAQFGRTLGLEKSKIQELATGGLLLDIGKSQLPLSVLNKTSALTTAEIELLRSHVDKSIQILVNTDDIPHEIMRMVASHHERYDGSGYPLGIQDEDIPLYGKLAGICDSFVSMTKLHPYTKRSNSPHEAISNLYQLRDKLYHSDLIEQFIHTVGVYPTGSLVELVTGEVGVVFSINGFERLRPEIMVLQDNNKKTLEHYYFLNLSEHDEYSIKCSLKRGAYGIKIENILI